MVGDSRQDKAAGGKTNDPAADSVQVEDVFIQTPDNINLAATLHLPAAGDRGGRGNGITVQINSSMATPRQYYRAFATHLAARGFTLLAYDYRGVGGSLFEMVPAPHGRNSLDSGRIDQTVVADYLAHRFPDYIPTLVGHSFGGQMLGLTRHAARWRAVFLMGTSHGYYAKWPSPQRQRMWLRSHIMAPLLARMPRAWQKRMEEKMGIPFALGYEMSLYLRTPHFFITDDGQPIRPHNDELRAVIRHVTLSDDEVVPPGSDIDLECFYPNAPRINDRMTPADYGVQAVGHFGFFRRSMPTAAWTDAGDWLSAQVLPAQGAPKG
jgi:predicted alpha/beta hydrolase